MSNVSVSSTRPTRGNNGNVSSSTVHDVFTVDLCDVEPPLSNTAVRNQPAADLDDLLYEEVFPLPPKRACVPSLFHHEACVIRTEELKTYKTKVAPSKFRMQKFLVLLWWLFLFKFTANEGWEIAISQAPTPDAKLKKIEEHFASLVKEEIERHQRAIEQIMQEKVQVVHKYPIANNTHFSRSNGI